MPNMDEMTAVEALLWLPRVIETSPMLFVNPNKQETFDIYWDGHRLHVPTYVLLKYPNLSNYQNIIFLNRNVPQQVILKIINGCPFLFPKSVNLKTNSIKCVQKKDKLVKTKQKLQSFSNYPRCAAGQDCKISGMEAFSYFKNSRTAPFLLKCVSCSKYMHPCCVPSVKDIPVHELKQKSFRFKCDVCL